MLALDAQADVLLDRSRLKRFVIWNERARPRWVISSARMAVDPLLEQPDLAVIRREHAGDQVEGRGLAGPVRAQESMDRGGPNREIDAVYRVEAAEALDQALAGEDRVAG